MMRELGKVIIGQQEVLDQIFAAIISRGHCLLVGVPGLAKTMMVSALARIMDLSFKRIQFTPDLMPTDITGTNVIDENESGRREFRFVKGPIFAHIILADEINRTPPKTQAAMLQAMQEREVTVGQETYKLPDPFFVIATQNPIEQEGTYPLPEAQLDRFMFNIFVDYPTCAEEERILVETTCGRSVDLDCVFNGRQVLNMQKIVYSVPVSEYIVKYVAKLVRATRPKDPTSPDFVKEMVDWGAGPRAGQYLIMGGKAVAAMDGRYTVSIDDIKRVAVPVLRHRIGCNFAASSEGVDSVEIVKRLLAVIPEPEVPKYVPRKGEGKDTAKEEPKNGENAAAEPAAATTAAATPPLITPPPLPSATPAGQSVPTGAENPAQSDTPADNNVIILEMDPSEIQPQKHSSFPTVPPVPPPPHQHHHHKPK
ncbi:MAG: MoxR family ATPase [Planctomycetaceae bacterium]|nr:MAG: MoxR family ATPase [Planctomycetaceae bacterium]